MKLFYKTNLINKLIIDPTNDHLIKKIYKDGKTITFKYDPAGNMIEKSRTWSDGSQGQKLTYTYNYQDQIAQANDSGYNVMTAGYDHENQRVYTDMPGINPWNGQKFYYWNQSGAIIGEGKVGVNDYVARYFYSGNQKIAMERYDQTSGTSSFYYFINNAQGTPVLIVDEQNNAISKINLDEWGNVGDKTTGPQQEINYTGKKLDIPTRLYYFNQRYYDPEIGRFVNEDPACQAFNPYLYCGNNPLVYVDPDGQFWWVVAGAIAGAVIANWGKPVTLENTFKGAVCGAIAGGLLGAGLGLDSLAINWSFDYGVGAGVTLGVGGGLGILGNTQGSRPNHLSTPGQNQGSALAPGINWDSANKSNSDKFESWADRLGSSLKKNYSGTGIFDGVGEVLMNDYGRSTPKNQLDSLCGDWDTLNGYSGGGHSVRMAILSGRAQANNVNVFGSGLTNYEDIASGRAVNVYLSANDPVSWLYGSYGPTGPRILILPNGMINRVNYMMKPGVGHGNWQDPPKK